MTPQTGYGTATIAAMAYGVHGHESTMLHRPQHGREKESHESETKNKKHDNSIDRGSKACLLAAPPCGRLSAAAAPAVA